MTAATSAQRPGTALILVVEKDPHVRRLEEYFLERAGYAVEFAGDGEEALAGARARLPLIVITEILVPKLDGLALCWTLKHDPATAHTAVLILSILAAAERAREAGADAFLMKPLEDGKLIEVVEFVIHEGGPRVPGQVSS